MLCGTTLCKFFSAATIVSTLPVYDLIVVKASCAPSLPRCSYRLWCPPAIATRARRELKDLGHDLTDLQAGHSADSIINPFARQGQVGSTHYVMEGRVASPTCLPPAHPSIQSQSQLQSCCISDPFQGARNIVHGSAPPHPDPWFPVEPKTHNRRRLLSPSCRSRPALA